MKNIDKNVIYLGWVSFFTDMASSMITTLLPIFVVYILKEGVDKLGIIIAVTAFVSYAFRIVFGYLSDRFGIVKPFVVGGYLISALSKPLLAYSNSFASVAVLRGVERMGKAIRSASKDSLISSFVKNKAHGKTFGFHKMMDIAGEMSGAIVIFVSFIFFSQSEFVIREIFKLTFIPGLIATFIIFFFVKDAPKKSVTKDRVTNREDFKLFPLLFIYFGFVFFVMSEQFLILRAKDMGFGLDTIPLLVISFTAIQAISSYFGGVISDKIGIFKTLFISFCFGIFAIFIMKYNIWISFIFLGLFTVFSLNALRANISKNATSKGFVYGVFYGGVAISSSLGALSIGFIWKIYGFDNTLIFSEVGMLIMLSLLFFAKNWQKI